MPNKTWFVVRRASAPSTNEKARPLAGSGFGYGVAVTYFRVRMHTIIGANPFHGPVRDGKEWFQVAIAATWTVSRNEFHERTAANRAEETRHAGKEIAPSAKIITCAQRFDAHGYRVKPHGQLVLVS